MITVNMMHLSSCVNLLSYHIRHVEGYKNMFHGVKHEGKKALFEHLRELYPQHFSAKRRGFFVIQPAVYTGIFQTLGDLSYKR